MTKDEIIAGHILPVRKNLVLLIEMEGELKKSIVEKKEYLTITFPHEMSVLGGKISSRQIELRTIDTQIEFRKIELEKLQDSHETEHKTHSQKISTLRGTITEHSTDIENKKREILELELRKSSLTTDISILLKTKASALIELQKVLKECAEADEKLRNINNEIAKSNKIYAKIILDIKRIVRQKDVLIEDVLNDNHRKLYDRHQIQLGKSRALDEQILQKRKILKEIK